GVRAPTVCVGMVGGQLFEIMTRAKDGALGSDDNSAHISLVGNLRELRAQCCKGCFGKSVARLRAIEREDGNIALILPQEGRFDCRGADPAGRRNGAHDRVPEEKGQLLRDWDDRTCMQVRGEEQLCAEPVSSRSSGSGVGQRATEVATL